jgi:bacillithiol system protein YtxJ
MVAEVAIVYKHSPRCPTSRYAMHEVRSFADNRPDVPVYLVDVVKNRALSQQLADDLGVPHRSPQVILLRCGSVQADASHHSISDDLLERWVNEGAT